MQELLAESCLEPESVQVCLLALGGVHTAAFAAHYHQMLQLDPGAALSIDDVCSVILLEYMMCYIGRSSKEMHERFW